MQQKYYLKKCSKYYKKFKKMTNEEVVKERVKVKEEIYREFKKYIKNIADEKEWKKMQNTKVKMIPKEEVWIGLELCTKLWNQESVGTVQTMTLI